MKTYLAVLAAAFMASQALAASVKWQTDYTKALAQAKQEKKLVMVDVYTDWCGWCKKLDKDVYADAKVAERLTKDFVSLKINPEKSAANRQLAQKFGTRGYPHIVFLDADGKKISEIGGYVPADKFAAHLDNTAKKSK